MQGRRKGQLQPAKPRVLIYSRDIGDRTEQEKEIDWNLIAAARVGGRFCIIDVSLKLPKQHDVEVLMVGNVGIMVVGVDPNFLDRHHCSGGVCAAFPWSIVCIIL